MSEVVEKSGNGVVTFMTPQNFEGAIKIAETLSKSGLVPKDYQNKPADIVVAMAWGAELGLPPLSAIQNIAVINGRPALWGDAVLALIKTKPDYEYVKESFDEKNMTATCIAKRRNEPECSGTFSQKDAELAGLWGRLTWKAYPKRMLQMRARSFALRDAFPHHLKGIALAEEVQDFGNNKSNYDTNNITIIEPEAKKPDTSEEVYATDTTAWATDVQIDKIRQYGVSQLKHKTDEETASYIFKKAGLQIASLYDLKETEADELLKKMYPENV